MAVSSLMVPTLITPVLLVADRLSASAAAPVRTSKRGEGCDVQ